MVARPGQYQASFNAGELSPDVWGRSDIKQFYAGASLMQNAEPVPQGGFDQLPGSVEVGYVRGVLAEVDHAETYDFGPHTGPAVLLVASFAAREIAMVDVNGFLGNLDLDALFRIETSLDGVTWQALGADFNGRTSTRTRRLGLPPGLSRMATQVRLRLIGAPPAAYTLALGSFVILAETAPGLTGRSFEHTFSVESSFCIVITPGNADIWKGDDYVASVPLSASEATIPDMTREQRFDAMLVFHPDLAPQRIMRQDSNTDWSASPAPFTNIPQVDYGGAYGNTVADYWKITVMWSAGPIGLALELNINGEDTASTQLQDNGGGVPDWPLFCASLKLAIEALPSVQPGIAVTFNAGAAQSAEVFVEFSGAGNAGSRFAVIPRIVNVTTAAANASHLRFGDPGGEEIMSSAKGWPSTGNFYQDRLFLGGFRSETAALLGSVTGEYFDLNTKIENAAGGVLNRLDTSGAERIVFLARAKHLVIFTNEAEYYVSDRAIARGTVPNIAQSSRNGAAIGIRPVENDGSLLYVGRSRSVIYAATYSDVSQAYESEPISLLASHLSRGLRAAAIQRSSESTDAARYWVVRDDGLLVVGVMIRNQDVAAFVRWTTDGLVRDVVVDGGNVGYVLVERQIGAVRRLVRERLAPDVYLHQQRSFTFEAPQTVMSGLDSHEGAQVWAFADGFAQGPFTVAGGSITLPYEATSVQVGRWTAPIVDTLPLPRLVGEKTVLQRPVRVHTVRAQANGATSLAIGANGRPARDALFLRGGEVSDAPLAPRFGPVVAQGLLGWSEDGVVRITQTRPGAFAVRGLTIEARI